MKRKSVTILATAFVASLFFSMGQAQAADNYQFCQLLSPNGPSLKPMLEQKVTDPDELVSKILDPVAPLNPVQMEQVYKMVYGFIVDNYIDEANLSRIKGYENKYAGKLQTRKDLDRAIADLVSAMGDRWTWVASASGQMSHVLTSMSKQVSFGAGLRRENDGTFWIEHLQYGSSAQLSGLREGDVIVAVNDRVLQGLSKDDAEKLLLGAQGSLLKVKSIQDGKTVESSYTLSAPLENSPDAQLLKNNIAYFKLPDFMDEESFQAVIGAMTGMVDGVPGGVNGMILDLRYNGGGRVDFAKTLISFLLAKGTVINETSREGRTRLDQSTSILPLTQFASMKFSEEQLRVLKELQSLPLVILVNGSSASAAEIVTGSLMESRPNTTVMGERSFGKFEEMLVTTLPNCSTLAVTSARYTTPSGKWLHNVGITPDIVVHQPRNSHNDAQLAAALELLVKKTSDSPAVIVQKSSEDQPIIGPVPERPRPSVERDWKQIVSDYRLQITQVGVGAFLLSLFGVYLLLSAPARSDDDNSAKSSSAEKRGILARLLGFWRKRK